MPNPKKNTQKTFLEIYQKLIEQKNLTSEEAEKLMLAIGEGKMLEPQVAATLTALHTKGETFEEIYGLAKALKKKAITIKKPFREPIIDTCGTGGDHKSTFNISTISAIVLAALGVKVSKHGNRSITSKCGSADLLEKLGIPIHLSPEKIEKCLKEIGIAFLFAPNLHPVMKYVMPVRKALGFRTIFNVLGPLLNPMKIDYQIMGVYDKNYCLPLAKVLKALGVKRGMVLSSEDGLDEASVSAKTYIVEFNQKQLKKYWLSPEELGFKKYPLSSIVSKNLDDNKKIALNILEGKEKGAKKDIVVLNAALAFKVYKDIPLKKSLFEVEKIVTSGQASELLEKWSNFS